METVSSKQTIFANIKKALDAVPPLAAKEHREERFPPSSLNPEELIRRFTERLQQVGGDVHVGASAGAVSSTLTALIRDHKLKRILIPAEIQAVKPEVVTIIEEAGSEVWHCEETALERASEADAGITTADAGIVDTGTIILQHTAARGRLAALLPPIHIALLEKTKLFADKAAFLQYCRQNALDLTNIPMTWVTGSSSTADIEKVLVRGAHGPRQLIVLLQ